jgi:AraC-like DNA-binding protein
MYISAFHAGLSMIRFGINTKELEATIALIGRLLGIRVTFFDAEGEELPLASLRAMTPYCTLRRRDPAFDARCRACDRHHLAAARRFGKAQVYRCHDGLIEGIIPLFDGGGVHLGAMVFGQIRDASRKPGALPAKFARLRSRLPSFPLAKAEEIGTLLKYVSEYIIHSEIIKRRSLPWADKVEAYIQAHLSRPIRIAELARETGFSASFIHHRFKEDYGVSPARHITGLRMNLARERLMAGASVKETAAALGFRDPFHFSKAYKQRFGHPPSSAART